ncbi:MAG: tetratricopeptide repeat protein [Hyphomicrobium sp.]
MKNRHHNSGIAVIASIVLLTFAVPASAVDTMSSTDAPDLAAPRAMIKAKDWPKAIAELEKIAATTTHADVYSLLGFSLRKSGRIDEARMYYAKALDFDPKHKGAHEYLGELHVTVGDMKKANVQLAILEKLCPQGCEELTDLRKHIAETTATPAAAKTN